MSFFGSEMFTFVLLPLLIFLARIFDVTFGTIRIIFIARGHKYLAPLIGFFEILIWLVAIGKIMQNLNNVFCYIAYAGGFAAGTLIGICIEEKLAMGTLVIQIVTRKNATELIENLRATGYGITSIPAEGTTGRVHIIYTVIKRSDLDDVVEIIKQLNPKAFYSIEDVRFVSKAAFPLRGSFRKKDTRRLDKLFRIRKGK
jgi:uncharacterized protein YebE (UPF0316 family)